MGKDDTRKSVTLPDELWQGIADYRFTERIKTEAEALRRIVQMGLMAAGCGVPAPADADKPPSGVARLKRKATKEAKGK